MIVTKIMKYQISYTLKDENSPGMAREFFSTKKEANSWIKKNKNRLYWHKLTETNAKSKMARPIIMFEPDDSFIMKTGTLKTHFETGMEYLGLVFYEDGIHGPPNPKFNPDLPEDKSNFKNFASYDALIFIEHGMIIQFGDEKIAMMKDRDFATRDGYRFSFYPRGFSRSQLIDLFAKENIKAKLWIRKELK